MKFVNHRWLEELPVIRRCLDILPHIRQYATAIEPTKLPDPKIKSYSTIKDNLNDPLLEVKLNFVLNLAETLRLFLIKYQSEKPLLLFIFPDLIDITQIKNL